MRRSFQAAVCVPNAKDASVHCNPLTSSHYTRASTSSCRYDNVTKSVRTIYIYNQCTVHSMKDLKGRGAMPGTPCHHFVSLRCACVSRLHLCRVAVRAVALRLSVCNPNLMTFSCLLSRLSNNLFAPVECCECGTLD